MIVDRIRYDSMTKEATLSRGGSTRKTIDINRIVTEGKIDIAFRVNADHMVIMSPTTMTTSVKMEDGVKTLIIDD